MKNTSVLGFVLLVCSLATVHGWGQEGHQIVGQIAQDYLTPDALAAVNSMTGGKTLEYIAALPDSYRSTSQGSWTSTCHYVDLPQSALVYSPSYCPAFCVVKSVQNYTDILDHGNGAQQKCNYSSTAEPCAVEFLTHYTGDIHQPLHVGYAEDKGGNDVTVNWYGKSTNLHAVWDSSILSKWNSDLNKAVADLEAYIDSNPNEVAQILAVMDPEQWADESYEYVLTTVYDFSNSTLSADSSSVPNLDDAYYNRNIPVVKHQLIAGGLRLAQILNNIFTKDVVIIN
jgi:hypothetical protein